MNSKPSLNKINNKVHRSRTKARTPANKTDAGFSRLNAHVLDFLKNVFSQHGLLAPIIKLGFSGGMDSCVLLASLVEARKTLAFDLHVIHVHHGLSPNADHWAAFCESICRDYGLLCKIERVTVDKKSGLGIEASARNARYQALMYGQFDYLVLAHHQDDQAETLLLQLFRGAGLKGLSAMASISNDGRLLRPFLDIPRQHIEACAKAAKLSWIEDESNDDLYFDRNYCRHQLMPIIDARFPAASKTLARSASHIAEGACLLDELAEIDAKTYLVENTLKVDALKNLSRARAINLLRWWLSQSKVLMPSKSRLDEMFAQLCAAKSDTRLKVQLNNVQLRRYQGFVYIEPEKPASNFDLLWQGEGKLVMPDGSNLIFEYTLGQGLAIQRLGVHKLRITNRLGGEKFKPDLNRPTRTLKYLLQEINMPPWQRERLPLVYLDDSLAVVPNVGVNCQMQAAGDEQGLVITWQPS